MIVKVTIGDVFMEHLHYSCTYNIISIYSLVLMTTVFFLYISRLKCWNIVADLICTCITVSTRVHRPWLQSILNISVLIQYAQKFRYAKFRVDHSQKRKLKKNFRTATQATYITNWHIFVCCYPVLIIIF